MSRITSIYVIRPCNLEFAESGFMGFGVSSTLRFLGIVQATIRDAWSYFGAKQNFASSTWVARDLNSNKWNVTYPFRWHCVCNILHWILVILPIAKITDQRSRDNYPSRCHKSQEFIARWFTPLKGWSVSEGYVDIISRPHKHPRCCYANKAAAPLFFVEVYCQRPDFLQVPRKSTLLVCIAQVNKALVLHIFQLARTPLTVPNRKWFC